MPEQDFGQPTRTEEVVVTENVKILVINNAGKGFAEFKEFPTGTRYSDIFKEIMGPDAKPEDFTIRVNQNVVSTEDGVTHGDKLAITSTVASANDRLTVAPKKVAGAM